jgi:hypothetical protein
MNSDMIAFFQRCCQALPLPSRNLTILGFAMNEQLPQPAPTVAIALLLLSAGRGRFRP